jgi:hypothetical protein
MSDDNGAAASLLSFVDAKPAPAKFDHLGRVGGPWLQVVHSFSPSLAAHLGYVGAKPRQS